MAQRFETDDGYKLGDWSGTQRQRYGKGNLSADRIARLEGLGFDWDLLASAWEEGYSQLQTFKEREGHANVAQRFETDDGYKLGNWSSHQRQRYGKGDLSADRIVRLEAIGFRWNA